MHELSITKLIIQQTIDACKEHNITKVRSLRIELGQLATYEKEPIEFYFDAMKKDYGELKNAVLCIDQVTGQLTCNTCNKKSDIHEPMALFCTHCDSTDCTISAGRDIFIKDIQGNDNV
jgi:hydrogenase nickel incorporation protein HypA/HybF